MPVEERWITAVEMEETAKKAKINRRSRLGAFTRKQKHLQTMIDRGAESNLLENLYSDLSEAYNAVEKAHEDLCLVLDEDHEDAADSYLDDPSSALASMHVSVSKAVTDNQESVATANEEPQPSPC